MTPRWFEGSAEIMGTFVSVAVCGTSLDRALQWTTGCLEHMRQQAAPLNHRDPSSAVSRLNRERSLPIPLLPPSLLLLLQRSVRLHEETDGLFSPYLLEITTLYRHAKSAGHPPDPTRVEDAWRRALTTQLTITPDTVVLTGEGCIDPDGIGKGLVVDLGREWVRDQGAVAARISCGGDLAFFGDGPWKIEVARPFSVGIAGTLVLHHDLAVASSGNSHNSYQVGTSRIGHLFNPVVGKFTTTLAQATVVAARCADANAWASAACFQTPEWTCTKASGTHGPLGAVLQPFGAPPVATSEVEWHPASVPH